MTKLPKPLLRKYAKELGISVDKAKRTFRQDDRGRLVKLSDNKSKQTTTRRRNLKAIYSN